MILRKYIPLILCFFFLGLAANAEEPVYTGLFGNIALGGYDSVSYFEKNGEPVKGDKIYTFEWRGAEWRFSNQKNLELFRENPKAFAPQYGGYCAWAISQGKLAKGDPKVYALVNGKLYLNYSKKIEKRWHINRDNFIRLAEVEYPQLVDLSESSNN